MLSGGTLGRMIPQASCAARVAECSGRLPLRFLAVLAWRLEERWRDVRRQEYVPVS